MLTASLNHIPIVNNFSRLILFIIFIISMYFSFTTGSAVCIISAYFCPIGYLVYHFAIKSKDNSNKSHDT